MLSLMRMGYVPAELLGKIYAKKKNLTEFFEIPALDCRINILFIPNLLDDFDLAKKTGRYQCQSGYLVYNEHYL